MARSIGSFGPLAMNSKASRNAGAYLRSVMYFSVAVTSVLLGEVGQGLHFGLDLQ
jgi:hypothetical protein